MIDLGFLTEKEQEQILTVLKRDAELRKVDEERVKTLQRSVSDKRKLRYMSGEWFYKAKSRRHRDRIHGSDIVIASMRQTRKPMTILEQAQRRPERPSFVSSSNQDVHVPPELSGLIEEPHVQLRRDKNCNPHEETQQMFQPVSQSPTKQRQNPFNSELLATPTLDTSDEENGQSVNEPEEQTKTPGEETLPSSDSHICHATDLKRDSPENSPVTRDTSVQTPVTRRRTATRTSQDSPPEVDGPADREANSAPRGILKRMSSSSSADSLSCWSPPQGPVSMDVPAGSSPDRRQVRFSSAVGRNTGEELGEHSLLDVDCVTPPVEEETTADSQNQDAGLLLVPGDQSENHSTELLTPQVANPLLAKQGSGKPVDLDTGTEEDGHFQAKARGWFIWGLGFSDKPKLPRQPSDKSMLPKKPSDKLEIAVEAASDSKPSSGAHSKSPPRAVSPTLRKKLLGMFSRGEAKEKSPKLQIPYKEEGKLQKNITLLTSDLEPHFAQEESVQQGANDQARHEDIPQEEMEAMHGPQNIQSNEEVSSPLNLSKEEGTYRASPILICEVADDMDSQILQPLENVTNPLPASLPCDTSEQQRDIPVPLPRLSSPQESKSTVINDLRSFWEKGYPEPRTILGRVKEATRSPTHSSSVKSPINLNQKIATSHSELRASGSSGEKVGEEVQTSLFGTKSINVVPTTKGMHASEKGFVNQSSDKLQTRSYGCASDVETQYQQYLLETETSALSQQRPPSPLESPSRLHTPRSRDSSDDELRRSPSKTCHPKALPRESSYPSGSRREGSPLKTFPIDIAQPTKEHEKQPDRPTPVARRRKSPSHEAKQCSPTHSTESVHIGQQPTKRDFDEQKQPEPLKKSGTFTRVARSFIPQDYRHYLGEPDKTHLPPFHQGKVADKSSANLSPPAPQLDAGHGPQSPLKVYDEPQIKSANEERHSRISTWLVQNSDSGFSHDDDTSRACSLSRASSASHDDSSLVRRLSSKAKSSSKSLDNLTSQPTVEEGDKNDQSGPVDLSVDDGHDDSRLVRRLSSKAKSSSKSLDNLTSRPTVEEGDTNDQSGPVDLSVDDEEGDKNDQSGPVNISVDDASALPRPASPLSDPEQMKNKSVSVPDFHLEEGDSDDGTLEEFHRTRWGRRNTGSSLLSNTSLSSGMASMSSVSGSVMSIPAEVEGIEVQGTVQFAMNYVQKLGEFHIFVVHCRDLAVAEPKKNRSDPYVKCYLLPDKTKLGKRKTSVKKRTLNPIYNEIIRFKIEMESLKSQKLNISVWHNDNFGRNSFLGEVDLDLSEWNFSNTQIDDYALNARASAPPPTRPGSVDKGGEMRLALRFLPQMAQNKRASKVDETGEVQIWVKDCKNLPPVRGVIIDPFVKCTVLPDKSRGSRRKTRVVKRTANPMFNHTMVYDGFRPEDLREACVEITVWDHDRLQNHYIGGLRLGLGTGKSYGAEVGWMDSTTAEASLWERMMQSHAEWVEDVLPLRMLLMAKGMSK